MLGFALLLAAGLLILWLSITLYTVRLIGNPPRRGYAWTVSRGVPADPSELSPPRRFESFTIKNPRWLDTILPVWSIEGDDAAGPVVIFSHGWGESKSSVLPRVPALAPRCSRILAWDMPGHGEATNGRSPLGTNEWHALSSLVELAQGEDLAAREAHVKDAEHEQEDQADWESVLNDPPKAGSPRVVLYGFSLGAGISLVCASQYTGRIAGVIAEAPYRKPWTPARNVLRAMALPWRTTLRPAMWLLGFTRDDGPSWRGFDRAEVAPELRCPVLVLHGTSDEVCPIEDGRTIARAAKHGQITEIPNARHMDLWTTEPHRETCAESVAAFLRRIPRDQEG